ncbi:anthranilate synthase component I [Humidisolicoccus flavus]|uniref:anthranilate synthase component I n=1 Tax=Humidisolicoccus flavus TaxID=3111414 RepID=UPI003243B0C9
MPHRCTELFLHPDRSGGIVTLTRDEFDALALDHAVIPVTRTLFADAETPMGVYRKLAFDRPGSFLLESAEQGVWSRFSFVGISSFGLLTARDGATDWLDFGLSRARAFGDDVERTPLEALAHLQSRWSTPRIPGLPRFTGGLVGHVGWEAVRELEHLPNQKPREINVPDLGFSFASEVIAFDHRAGTITLIATALNDGTETLDQLWDGAQRQLGDMQARLAEPSDSWLATIDMTAEPKASARVEANAFEAAVQRAQQHIIDGDVFQVVLSTRFDVASSAPPIDVYRALRVLNPSPYMYLLALEDQDREPYSIVGSSPEALVTVHEGTATMHPIAGSRPRGHDAASDALLGDDLLNDPKEVSEHVMLVDLARNDLQKVCQPGTVQVTEFMAIERFSHIMHIVSTVEGELSTPMNAIDAFRATFPAGTLSGAPKPRALEIIDDLEPAQRGVYGGVVGYFDFAGDADVAIAIRTVTLRDGYAHVQAGAGLVADSVPSTELQEAHNKAAAPLRAVAIANTLRRITR